MTDHDDEVFKRWADGYVDQYGRTLLQEQRNLDERAVDYATPRADARIRMLTGQRSKPKRTPLFVAAAALLVAFIGAGAALFPLFSHTEDGFAPSQSADVVSNPAGGDDTIHELDFVLPTRFSVASVESDRGETIYHLDNDLYDDAVLTIKDSGKDDGRSRDIDTIMLDGTPVPAKLRDEYKLLTFTDGGLDYTISCRDDIATLASLYRSITGS